MSLLAVFASSMNDTPPHRGPIVVPKTGVRDLGRKRSERGSSVSILLCVALDSSVLTSASMHSSGDLIDDCVHRSSEQRAPQCGICA